LPCGVHTCPAPCHAPPCSSSNTPCSLPCPRPRECGHPCLAPCHPGTPCPALPCTAQLRVSCECGHRQSSTSCSDNTFSQMNTALLATKMSDLQLGNSAVNLAELAKRDRKLECNEDCFKLERNAKLAAALNIANPELSSKVIPRYSDFMKEWTKRDANFCLMVHTELSKLVRLAKESKHKSRSFSFPCMNRDKRTLVHEYAEHFGCESVSFDAEPKRNVVVTAAREKCFQPAVSLLETTSRQKKAPAPVAPWAASTNGSGTQPTFTNLARAASEQSETRSEPKIDWFG